MPTDPTPPPTPLEASIDALAAAYGLSPEAVVDMAIRNLAVIAAYQLGRENADARRVMGMLVAPALAPRAQEAVRQKTPAARGDEEILAAAAAMTEPFSSRDLAKKTGRSSGTIGQVLTKAGWPNERGRGHQPCTWLPRQAG